MAFWNARIGGFDNAADETAGLYAVATHRQVGPPSLEGAGTPAAQR